ncbi:unnamed protein product [Arabidopsis lyrata]|uniref:Predicted protein n=1 Tax=Arabidopsis lyrata subsp. lyrata TaxID=81972 RepID=D7KQ72_ARALL|nr:predicted protein [Arabidopsis lyrata subsp. lyrata]CAH8250837.1 unnamed protein product [Arabidopsis lyrata]
MAVVVTEEMIRRFITALCICAPKNDSPASRSILSFHHAENGISKRQSTKWQN